MSNSWDAYMRSMLYPQLYFTGLSGCVDAAGSMFARMRAVLPYQCEYCRNKYPTWHNTCPTCGGSLREV